MKAVVCESFGPIENVVLRKDWPEPEPGPDDVLIDVKAAAFNFPDVLIVQGLYQMKPELPFVPGAEGAGVVAAVGANVTGVAVGDKVVAMGAIGAFAERMVAPASAIYPKPAALSMAEAASIGMTYFTSYHALKQRAALAAGETLLVLGAGGGVGLAAVELGKVMGARVIAAASTEEKLKLAREKGAEILINYSEQPLKDTVKDVTDGRGVDVVYDPVGGDYSEAALRCMAWKGRFLVVGFANGEIPRIPLNLPLLKGCSIVGVYWGAFGAEEPELQRENVEELWAMLEAGAIRPAVSDSWPIEDYAAAFECLADRRARGKVALVF